MRVRMKKKLLFVLPSLVSGGAEKSLVSLLQTIDSSRYDVDLFLFRREGLFLPLVPPFVRVTDAGELYAVFDGNAKNADIYGKYNITAGPSGWAWGGSWLAVSPKCNTGKIAHDFVEFFTVNPDTMKKYALYSGDFANNKAAMEEIVAEGSNSNALLGGQDQFAVLSDVAANIKMSDSISKYDQSLKDTFLTALKDNIKEDSDTIIEKFTTDALAANPDLSK